VDVVVEQTYRYTWRLKYSEHKGVFKEGPGCTQRWLRRKLRYVLEHNDGININVYFEKVLAAHGNED